MAQTIELIDGFEDYPDKSSAGTGLATYWHVQQPNWTDVSLIAGRVGGKGVRLQNENGSYGSTTPRLTHMLRPDNEKSVFFAFRVLSWRILSSFDSIIFECRSSTASVFHVTYNALRELKIWQGATLLGTVVDKIFLNTYYSLAVSWKRGLSDGVMQLKLDGELLFNITNAKTANAADELVDRIVLLVGAGSNEGNNSIEYDDVRVDTGGHALIEEGRYVEMVFDDDQLAQWTPSTPGKNYAMVDESNVDKDTTYNQTNVVGNRDLFKFKELAFNPDRIFALRVAMTSRKVDVATRRTAMIVQSGPDEFQSPDKYESTDYFRQVAILEKDVDVAVDGEWTKASLLNHYSGYTLVE